MKGWGVSIGALCLCLVACSSDDSDNSATTGGTGGASGGQAGTGGSAQGGTTATGGTSTGGQGGTATGGQGGTGATTTITGDGVTIIVPDNAGVDPTTLSVAKASGSLPALAVPAFSDAYTFLPHGQVFQAPLTIIIPATSAPSPQGSEGVWQLDDDVDTQWDVENDKSNSLVYDANANTYTFQATSFCTNEVGQCETCTGGTGGADAGAGGLCKTECQTYLCSGSNPTGPLDPTCISCAAAKCKTYSDACNVDPTPEQGCFKCSTWYQGLAKSSESFCTGSDVKAQLLLDCVCGSG
jgi:hypothetical protein